MVAFFLYKNTLCNVCKIKMQEQEITSDEIYENSSIVDFTITGYKNDENHFILQRNCLYLQKTKKRTLLADKITGDNIYKALIF